MKRLSHFFALIFVAMIFASYVNAQTAISDEKRKLIAELVVLMKMDKSVVDITDAMLKSLETTYIISFNHTVDRRPDLTSKQKVRLKASSESRYSAFSNKFRERLPQAVDYHKYIEDTVYPLYDKFYTEQELKDLDVFYRSPTGQKVITTMPELYRDSTKMAQETLMPQILKLIDQIMKEDLENIEPPNPVKVTRN